MANAEVAVESGGEETRAGLALDQPLGDYVQAHLGRASKFADGKTRNWTVFFFFRIMSQASVEASAAALQRLVTLLRAPDRSDEALRDIRKAAAEALWTLKDPALMNARISKQALAGWGDPERARLGAADGTSNPPAEVFRALLEAAVNRDFRALLAQQRILLSLAGIDLDDAAALRVAGTRLFSEDFRKWIEPLLALAYERRSSEFAEGAVEQFAKFWAELGLQSELERIEPVWLVLILILVFVGLWLDPIAVSELFEGFSDKPAAAGYRALGGGLLGVCLYEILRQLQPAALQFRQATAPRQSDDGVPAIVRSEIAEQEFSRRARSLKWDPCPINYAFTFSGLSALNLDPTTLASFPDPFKEGMAARAQRLSDTGPSAPEKWDGTLGVNDVNNLMSVHGYFTSGFLVGDDQTPVKDSLWQALRDDVAAFNARSEPKGSFLRLCLNCLFNRFGLEVVQIELGEDPYEVDREGYLCRDPYRMEHFGFADGVSQPFVYLGHGMLFDPPPGGGTPGPNGTWKPLAPGEIYLDERDEDGNVQDAPVNQLLRKGSTYAAFRKLEQNVPEFRTYLAKQRPKDAEAQLKLASEFVGRWPDGAPLVLAPDRELALGDRPQNVINNFLYAADDPNGRRCPLGAHIRRTNPRDTGGTNEVRRHRILRRSISYGGPLLPHGSIGDGRKRGLLFVALNSRIDLQFELIQGKWINTGELLGQAGLNRCPVTGANLGGPSDAFLEVGAVAPVTGLPRFVATRGGDYFFAPGIGALKAIAAGDTFAPDGVGLPYDGFSMDDANTPSLFNPLLDPDRLPGYAKAVLSGAPPVIRIAAPPSVIPGDPAGSPVAFVGQHADVVRVLSTVATGAPLVYSVAPYREAGQRITRGHDLIEGTEVGLGSNTAREHALLHEVLDAAWTRLNTPPGIVYGGIDAILNETLDLALRRVATRGSIDLVTDLALASVYQVVDKVFGVSGPDWVTELAIALPFYRQHVGELLPGWLNTVKTPAPPIPALATLQTWSIALVFDVVANYERAAELMAISDQAAGEFLQYLDALIATVRTNALSHPVRYPRPATLVEAFVANEGRFVGAGRPYSTAAKYYLDVATLLMDLAASAIAFIPNVFGYVMDAVLNFGLDLSTLIPILSAPPQYGAGAAADGIPRLIYETCRLGPPAPILMRSCVRDDVLPSGGAVNEGDFVAAMVAAAGVDCRVFTDPYQFSLYPFLPGPPRNLSDYFLFGVVGGGRVCWGRDRLALLALEECLKAAGRLKNLRKVAGPGGELQANLGPKIGIALGLEARFDRVLPDWPRRGP
jgi:Dyp-type peroxidase family